MLLRGCFWIAVYLALVLTPLFVLLIGPTPPAEGFRWDFSLALGFASLTMMAIMFLLTARFKWATAPYGIDVIYYFHRQTSLVALVFVIAHPVLIFWASPHMLTLLWPPHTPWHLSAGIGSFLAMIALMVTSLRRKQLGIEYDNWRLGHVLLAVTAVVLGALHIAGVGHFVEIGWKRGLWGLIGVSCIAAFGYVRLYNPARQLRRHYRVTEVIEERGSAWTLVLRPEGHGGLTFQAGQFAWLTLWNSPFALKEHPFSFSSSAERKEITFTIKTLGDFTNRIPQVRPGEIAYLDAPYGAFSIDRHPKAEGYFFIAGGIGIAPIMSMLRTLADRGDKRPLHLIYAYSSWDRMTFREELQELAQKLNLVFVPVLGEPHEGWEGETGIITPELLGRHLSVQRTERVCFVCGPVPMIELVEHSLSKAGVPLSHIHSELFDLV
jgi:predicted ferric reductase